MKRTWLMMGALAFFLFAQAAQADWSPAKRLTWTSGYSWWPAVAIDSSSTIHVVWRDDTPGNAEIYYKGSTDGGTTWSAVKRLTWTSGESLYPAIGIDSMDAIHVVWHDDTPGNREIYYKRSQDGGETWSGSQRLTWALSWSVYADIAIDSSNAIHVLWEDYREGTGNGEIFYKRGD